MGLYRENLDQKQDHLIFALLKAETKEEASRISGIPRSTMYRWLADPTFRAAYQRARHAVFDDALAILQMGAVKAANALVEEIDYGTPQQRAEAGPGEKIG